MRLRVNWYIHIKNHRPENKQKWSLPVFQKVQVPTKVARSTLEQMVASFLRITGDTGTNLPKRRILASWNQEKKSLKTKYSTPRHCNLISRLESVENCLKCLPKSGDYYKEKFRNVGGSPRIMGTVYIWNIKSKIWVFFWMQYNLTYRWY